MEFWRSILMIYPTDWDEIWNTSLVCRTVHGAFTKSSMVEHPRWWTIIFKHSSYGFAEKNFPPQTRGKSPRLTLNKYGNHLWAFFFRVLSLRTWCMSSRYCSTVTKLYGSIAPHCSSHVFWGTDIRWIKTFIIPLTGNNSNDTDLRVGTNSIQHFTGYLLHITVFWN